MDLHSRIADHRRRLAEGLASLTPDQWDAPSLCDGWAVRHVVAHITMPFRFSRTRFVAELARSGGRFHAMSDRVARRDGAAEPEELLAQLREHASNPWTPPGGGQRGALTHDVVHGLDITIPLGIAPAGDVDDLRLVLDSVTGGAAMRHFGVELDGLELRAEDLDWSFGSGQQIGRPAHELVALVAGRRLPDGTDLRTGSIANAAAR